MNIYLRENNNWKYFKNLTVECQELRKRNIIISDYAEIGDYAKIGDCAEIGNYVILQNHIYIKFCDYSMTYTGNRTVSIGCKNFTIEKWLTEGEEIARLQGRTERQIVEYRAAIEMIDKLTKGDIK